MEELRYNIDFFTPDDAPGVVSLFRAVYGEYFPVREVYDQQALISQDKTGEAYRMVARSPAGEIVGHISLFRSTPPNPTLYEAGCLMVRHDYRQTDLSFTLFSTITSQLMKKHQITQVWGEAVCNHLFSQQSACREGLIEAALEMDLMPQEAYSVPGDQSSGGRVSTLTIFLLLEKKPRIVYLPPCYDGIIRELFAPFNQECTFLASDTTLLPSGKTIGESQVFSTAGLARITLDEIGQDFSEWIEKTVGPLQQDGVVVIQVFMKLTFPHIGWAVAHLQSLGFFIGGILPVWFGDDGFLMQKIIGVPNFEGTHVYSKRAKMIKEYVHNDWLERNGV